MMLPPPLTTHQRCRQSQRKVRAMIFCSLVSWTCASAFTPFTLHRQRRRQQQQALPIDIFIQLPPAAAADRPVITYHKYLHFQKRRILHWKTNHGKRMIPIGINYRQHPKIQNDLKSLLKRPWPRRKWCLLPLLHFHRHILLQPKRRKKQHPKRKRGHTSPLNNGMHNIRKICPRKNDCNGNVNGMEISLGRMRY
jgi:hypothetical protein